MSLDVGLFRKSIDGGPQVGSRERFLDHRLSTVVMAVNNRVTKREKFSGQVSSCLFIYTPLFVLVLSGPLRSRFAS